MSICKAVVLPPVSTQQDSGGCRELPAAALSQTYTQRLPSRQPTVSLLKLLTPYTGQQAYSPALHTCFDLGQAFCLLNSSVSQNKEYERAKNSAIGSLSLRPHSRKELVDKLIDKGYSQKAIDRALDRLKEVVNLS